jgi:hypothetical protein
VTITAYGAPPYRRDRGGTARAVLGGIVVAVLLVCSGFVAYKVLYCRVIFFPDCAANLIPQVNPPYVTVDNQPLLAPNVEAAVTLIGSVADMMGEPSNPEEAGFIAGVKFLTTALLNANQLVECGYETGSVNVMRYKNGSNVVGAAVVFNGTLTDVFITTSKCFLGKKWFGPGFIPTPLSPHRVRPGLVRAPVPAADPVPTDPAPVICDAIPTSVADHAFTVLTIGSDAGMCTALTGEVDTGNTGNTGGGNTGGNSGGGSGGNTGTATTRTDVILHTGPSTGTQVLMTAPQGTGVTVNCYTDGEYRSQDGYGSSARWANVTVPQGTIDHQTHVPIVRDLTGFMWGLFLDTGGDLASQGPACSGGNSGTGQDAPFDVHAVKYGDCLINSAGFDQPPQLRQADCNTPSVLKVTRILVGDQIPRDSAGNVSEDDACSGVAHSTHYDADDVYLCLERINVGG